MSENDVDSLRRMERLLLLLAAARQAGITPIKIQPLHAFAYLANVLAPVWHMRPLNERLLKRQGGPYYTDMQTDLDRMVGMGLARIVGVTHTQTPDGSWRLEGAYEPHPIVSRSALDFVREVPENKSTWVFVQELAYALSAMPTEDLASALVEDATYVDPASSDDTLLNLDARNPSLRVAQYFKKLRSNGVPMSPGEQIHLYVRHLHARRAHGG